MASAIFPVGEAPVAAAPVGAAPVGAAPVGEAPVGAAHGRDVARQLPVRDKVLLVGTPAALAAAFGTLAPNAVRNMPGQGLLLWLRPEQWLLLGGRPVTGGEVAVLEAGARFVEFGLAGARAADLLAAGCSIDFRERAFAPGRCAQSRIEQVPVILYREALDRFTVIVERPLARYLGRWLGHSAALQGDGGGEIA